MKPYFVSSTEPFSTKEVAEFSLETAQGKLDLFIIKHDEQFHAYHNQCPHLGIPLNWQPDDFLSLDKAHIQCSTHGALFNPEDGYCIVGPCSGQNLTKLKIENKTESGLWVYI